MRSALYTGTVMHARRTPAENVFRYPVCFYLLDLDELPELERRLALFAYNRRNVLTLHDRDHLGDPRRAVKENLLAWLAEGGVDLEGGQILLLTNLRVLGYVFNPVSFFYCYGRTGELACVVAEVSNTSGERLPYLLSPANEVPSQKHRSYRADKRLHVSPFFSMDQSYRFFFSEPGGRVYARIDLFEDGARPFQATLVGRRKELTNAAVARALLRYPLMPAQVIGLIHWQALKLFVKGVPFFGKPPFVPGEGSARARPKQGSAGALRAESPSQGGESIPPATRLAAYRPPARTDGADRVDSVPEARQFSAEGSS